MTDGYWTPSPKKIANVSSEHFTVHYVSEHVITVLKKGCCEIRAVCMEASHNAWDSLKRRENRPNEKLPVVRKASEITEVTDSTPDGSAPDKGSEFPLEKQLQKVSRVGGRDGMGGKRGGLSGTPH